ncbi:MAG TPA: phage holin family protein [Vicinamibacterales bacterium]|nr:phage holin family protein [Vicinamibacterales bacterium]
MLASRASATLASKMHNEIAMTARPDADTSFGELIGDVLRDVRTLVRQEVALARVEVREEIRLVLLIAGLIAAGAGTLGIGGVWILVGITRAIARMFEWPLAGVFAGIGAVLVVIGLIVLAIAWRQVGTLRLLPRTRASLQENAEWAARHVKPAV